MSQRMIVTLLGVAVAGVVLASALPGAPARSDPILPLPSPVLPSLEPPDLTDPLPDPGDLLPGDGSEDPDGGNDPQQPGGDGSGDGDGDGDGEPPLGGHGSKPRAADPDDPGGDMYPHPPFAPTRGNPDAVLLQQLYEAQVTQRAVRNRIQTTEARLAALTVTVRGTGQALLDARRARDQATNGVRDTVLSIYKSGAAPGLYTAVESGVPGVIRAGAQGRLATIRSAGSRAEVLEKRLADAVAERDTLTKRLTSLHDRARQADAEVVKVMHRVAGRLPDQSATVGAKTLRWPVRGEVTSGYGNRYDPYHRRWQLHAGIDIEATTGTLVRAAATGRVVRAGWFGGYGNYVCLAHTVVRGQRMTTCYGHQSAILVTKGQRIRAGDPVGQVGSTGASTGPHLHFEVRLGGRPTDPRPWL